MNYDILPLISIKYKNNKNIITFVLLLLYKINL